MNINCINNKIATANGVLQPIILQSIKDIYLNGNHKMTARMVKNQCIIIDNNIQWNGKPAAICNAMRNAIKCGGRIVGEDRDFLDFTIAFDGNNLEISTPKKTNLKVESKKKDELNISAKPSQMNPKIELEKLNLSKNFKLVMICAGGKHNSFFKAYPKENFVNKPELITEHHPDDKINDKKISWRDYLIKNQSDTNLKKAFDLYNPTKTKYPNIYRDLFNKYKTNFFILSAGWGLVNSEYRLPKYDITFSSAKNILVKKRRKNKPKYKDFNQFFDENKKLIINPEEDLVFIGGRDYLELFYNLTQNLSNRKIIYFKGSHPTQPKLKCENIIFRPYIHSKPKIKTNWHYELANKISHGVIP